MQNIIELAKNCPDITINVKLSDLLEMTNHCIEKTKTDLEQLITDANTETYPSAEKVADYLGVTTTTLWRWEKGDYLKPVRIGGKVRYRMSDVKALLEGGVRKSKGGR